MTIEAAVVSVPICVATDAPVHFHAFPWMGGDAGNIVTPDIAAVPADPVHLIDREMVGTAMRAVAFFAFDLRLFHMHGMRKVGIVGLAGVDFPGDLFVQRHILFNERFLVLRGPDGSRMAFGAFGDGWDALEAAIRGEFMAHIACHAVLFTGVNGMIELERLGFSLIECHGERKPSDDQRKQNACQKQHWTFESHGDSLQLASGEKKSLKT
jgi:hypothetical protein